MCYRKESLPVVQKRIVKRGRFKFSMIGIKIGECVTFIPTNTEVKVASDDSVEYEGRIYKLSPLSERLCQKKNEIRQVHIKGQNISHIKGKY